MVTMVIWGREALVLAGWRPRARTSKESRYREQLLTQTSYSFSPAAQRALEQRQLSETISSGRVAHGERDTGRDVSPGVSPSVADPRPGKTPGGGLAPPPSTVPGYDPRPGKTPGGGLAPPPRGTRTTTTTRTSGTRYGVQDPD